MARSPGNRGITVNQTVNFIQMMKVEIEKLMKSIANKRRDVILEQQCG
jgi:hypothetical protein